MGLAPRHRPPMPDRSPPRCARPVELGPRLRARLPVRITNQRKEFQMKRAVLVTTLATVFFVAAGAPSLRSTPGTTMRFFIRDSAQSNLDLGDKGPSQGDQFFYHGTTFSKKAGLAIGRYAGAGTTDSATHGAA